MALQFTWLISQFIYPALAARALNIKFATAAVGDSPSLNNPSSSTSSSVDAPFVNDAVVVDETVQNRDHIPTQSTSTASSSSIANSLVNNNNDDDDDNEKLPRLPRQVLKSIH